MNNFENKSHQKQFFIKRQLLTVTIKTFSKQTITDFDVSICSPNHENLKPRRNDDPNHENFAKHAYLVVLYPKSL